MKNFFNSSAKASAVGIALLAIFAFTMPALAEQFGAKLLEKEGQVTVIIAATGISQPAENEMLVGVGDSIITGDDGIINILYDDGNVTALDENTTITIKQLDFDGKEQNSIINLSIGRIKNSITKAINRRVKFEVHTKSAVAGVTGTPPWAVHAFIGKNGKPKTNVDLLGKRGDKGSIFVRGGAGMSKMFTLTPGTRTTIGFGKPPVKPFKISNARRRVLKKVAVIKVKKKQRVDKLKVIGSATGTDAAASGDAELTVEEKVAVADAEVTEKATEADAAGTKADAAGTKADAAGTKADAAGTTSGATTGKTATVTKKDVVKKVVTSSSGTASRKVSTMMTHITRNISVPSVVVPGASAVGEETRSQVNTGSVTGGTATTTKTKTTATSFTRANLTFKLGAK